MNECVSCPTCGNNVVPSVNYEYGLAPKIISCLLCPFCSCCLPFLVPELKVPHSYCPKCNTRMPVSERKTAIKGTCGSGHGCRQKSPKTITFEILNINVLQKMPEKISDKKAKKVSSENTLCNRRFRRIKRISSSKSSSDVCLRNVNFSNKEVNTTVMHKNNERSKTCGSDLEKICCCQTKHLHENCTCQAPGNCTKCEEIKGRYMDTFIRGCLPFTPSELKKHFYKCEKTTEHPMFDNLTKIITQDVSCENLQPEAVPKRDSLTKIASGRQDSPTKLRNAKKPKPCTSHEANLALKPHQVLDVKRGGEKNQVLVSTSGSSKSSATSSPRSCKDLHKHEMKHGKKYAHESKKRQKSEQTPSRYKICNHKRYYNNKYHSEKKTLKKGRSRTPSSTSIGSSEETGLKRFCHVYRNKNSILKKYPYKDGQTSYDESELPVPFYKPNRMIYKSLCDGKRYPKRCNNKDVFRRSQVPSNRRGVCNKSIGSYHDLDTIRSLSRTSLNYASTSNTSITIIDKPKPSRPKTCDRGQNPVQLKPKRSDTCRRDQNYRKHRCLRSSSKAHLRTHKTDSRKRIQKRESIDSPQYESILSEMSLNLGGSNNYNPKKKLSDISMCSTRSKSSPICSPRTSPGVSPVCSTRTSPRPSPFCSPKTSPMASPVCSTRTSPMVSRTSVHKTTRKMSYHKSRRKSSHTHVKKTKSKTVCEHKTPEKRTKSKTDVCDSQTKRFRWGFRRSAKRSDPNICCCKTKKKTSEVSKCDSHSSICIIQSKNKKHICEAKREQSQTSICSIPSTAHSSKTSEQLCDQCLKQSKRSKLKRICKRTNQKSLTSVCSKISIELTCDRCRSMSKPVCVCGKSKKPSQTHVCSAQSKISVSGETPCTSRTTTEEVCVHCQKLKSICKCNILKESSPIYYCSVQSLQKAPCARKKTGKPPCKSCGGKIQAEPICESCRNMMATCSGKVTKEPLCKTCRSPKASRGGKKPPCEVPSQLVICDINSSQAALNKQPSKKQPCAHCLKQTKKSKSRRFFWKKKQSSHTRMDTTKPCVHQKNPSICDHCKHKEPSWTSVCVVNSKQTLSSKHKVPCSHKKATEFPCDRCRRLAKELITQPNVCKTKESSQPGVCGSKSSHSIIGKVPCHRQTTRPTDSVYTSVDLAKDSPTTIYIVESRQKKAPGGLKTSMKQTEHRDHDATSLATKASVCSNLSAKRSSERSICSCSKTSRPCAHCRNQTRTKCGTVGTKTLKPSHTNVCATQSSHTLLSAPCDRPSKEKINLSQSSIVLVHSSKTLAHKTRHGHKKPHDKSCRCDQCMRHAKLSRSRLHASRIRRSSNTWSKKSSHSSINRRDRKKTKTTCCTCETTSKPPCDHCRKKMEKSNKPLICSRKDRELSQMTVCDDQSSHVVIQTRRDHKRRKQTKHEPSQMSVCLTRSSHAARKKKSCCTCKTTSNPPCDHCRKKAERSNKTKCPTRKEEEPSRVTVCDDQSSRVIMDTCIDQKKRKPIKRPLSETSICLVKSSHEVTPKRSCCTCKTTPRPPCDHCRRHMVNPKLRSRRREEEERKPVKRPLSPQTSICSRRSSHAVPPKKSCCTCKTTSNPPCDHCRKQAKRSNKTKCPTRKEEEPSRVTVCEDQSSRVIRDTCIDQKKRKQIKRSLSETSICLDQSSYEVTPKRSCCTCKTASNPPCDHCRKQAERSNKMKCRTRKEDDPSRVTVYEDQSSRVIMDTCIDQKKRKPLKRPLSETSICLVQSSHEVTPKWSCCTCKTTPRPPCDHCRRHIVKSKLRSRPREEPVKHPLSPQTSICSSRSSHAVTPKKSCCTCLTTPKPPCDHCRRHNMMKFKSRSRLIEEEEPPSLVTVCADPSSRVIIDTSSNQKKQMKQKKRKYDSYSSIDSSQTSVCVIQKTQSAPQKKTGCFCKTTADPPCAYCRQKQVKKCESKGSSKKKESQRSLSDEDMYEIHDRRKPVRHTRREFANSLSAGTSQTSICIVRSDHVIPPKKTCCTCKTTTNPPCNHCRKQMKKSKSKYRCSEDEDPPSQITSVCDDPSSRVIIERSRLHKRKTKETKHKRGDGGKSASQSSISIVQSSHKISPKKSCCTCKTTPKPPCDHCRKKHMKRSLSRFFSRKKNVCDDKKAITLTTKFKSGEQSETFIHIVQSAQTIAQEPAPCLCNKPKEPPTVCTEKKAKKTKSKWKFGKTAEPCVVVCEPSPIPTRKAKSKCKFKKTAEPCEVVCEPSSSTLVCKTETKCKYKKSPEPCAVVCEPSPIPTRKAKSKCKLKKTAEPCVVVCEPSPSLVCQPPPPPPPPPPCCCQQVAQPPCKPCRQRKLQEMVCMTVPSKGRGLFKKKSKVAVCVKSSDICKATKSRHFFGLKKRSKIPTCTRPHTQPCPTELRSCSGNSKIPLSCTNCTNPCAHTKVCGGHAAVPCASGQAVSCIPMYCEHAKNGACYANQIKSKSWFDSFRSRTSICRPPSVCDVCMTCGEPEASCCCPNRCPSRAKRTYSRSSHYCMTCGEPETSCCCPKRRPSKAKRTCSHTNHSCMTCGEPKTSCRCPKRCPSRARRTCSRTSHCSRSRSRTRHCSNSRSRTSHCSRKSHSSHKSHCSRSNSGHSRRKHCN